MSYKLNKTDGSLLVELVDGQIDQTSTDLTLIGRNYTGFGEFYNENLIKMLENFASTSAPSTPLTGQLWFDTSEGRLKVYDGFGFRSNGPIVSNLQPQMVAGDIWIDNQSNKLYFFDGTDLVLVGPEYSAAQGLSGFQVDTITDRSSIGRTVVKLFIGGTLVAVLSNVEFTPVSSQTIPGIAGAIRKGINIIDQDTFRFFGLADATNSLITDQIDPISGERVRKTASQFLPSDANGETTGSIVVKNNAGITIGTEGNVQLGIAGTFFNVQQTRTNHSIRFRLNNSVDKNFDGLVITGDSRRVGVNLDVNQSPTSTLDVNGDARIRGSLTVEGSSTVLETQTLTVDDYNIELGHADTVLTLNTPVSPSVATSLVVGETIVQANSLSTGTFKSISDDRQTITLEPVNGLFTTNAADTLSGNTTGDLVQELNDQELVYVLSASQRNDVVANGAGIIVKGQASAGNLYDKHIKWINDTINGTNWEVSDNLNLVTGKSFKIDDDVVIDSNSLGTGIETAPSLRDIGVTDRLRVHNSMLLDEIAGVPTIKTTGVGLTIDSASTITVANQRRIGNVGNPIDNQDVATKYYTDTVVASEPLTAFIDVTGMPDGEFATQADQILDTIEFLYPAQYKELGTNARIYTVEYSGRVDGININEAMTKEWINVNWKTLIDGGDISVTRSSNNELQPPGDGSNQQLLEDVSFQSEVDGTVGLNVQRQKRYYQVQDLGNGKEWREIVAP